MLISGFQMVPRHKFFRERDCSRRAKPALDIEVPGIKAGRLEGSKRCVREYVDSQNHQIFAREIRKRDQTSHDRCRGGDTIRRRDHWKASLRKIPGRCGDFQFRLPSDEIDRRRECTIGAMIRNLGRQINRHAQRHAQNVQERQERMTPQMTQNMPPENAKILSPHLAMPFL